MAQNNWAKDILLCDPGIAHRQPLLIVASSSASHNPVHVRGSVQRNVLSWCGTTSPPIPGCYKEENTKEGINISNIMSTEKVGPAKPTLNMYID